MTFDHEYIRPSETSISSQKPKLSGSSPFIQNRLVGLETYLWSILKCKWVRVHGRSCGPVQSPRIRKVSEPESSIYSRSRDINAQLHPGIGGKVLQYRDCEETASRHCTGKRDIRSTQHNRPYLILQDFYVAYLSTPLLQAPSHKHPSKTSRQHVRSETQSKYLPPSLIPPLSRPHPLIQPFTPLAKGEHWAALAAESAQPAVTPNSQPLEVLLAHADRLYPFTSASGILDNGCGPGSAMAHLLATYGETLPPHAKLLCADFSTAMLDQVRSKIIAAPEVSPWKRVEVRVLDATHLEGVADGSLSHVVAGMVYFITPDPRECLRESRRVLCDGGAVACSSWESTQWMELMKLVSRVREGKVLPTLPERWSDAALLKGELEAVGFRDVKCERVEAEMRFATHEGLVEVLVEKLPHMVALTQDMSREEVGELKELMVREARNLDPNAPGLLRGVALVASGRK